MDIIVLGYRMKMWNHVPVQTHCSHNGTACTLVACIQGGNDGAKKAAEASLASTCPLVNEKGHANDTNQICYSQTADADIGNRYLLGSEIDWKTGIWLLDIVTLLFSNYTVDRADLKTELRRNKYALRITILESREVSQHKDISN